MSGPLIERHSLVLIQADQLGNTTSMGQGITVGLIGTGTLLTLIRDQIRDQPGIKPGIALPEPQIGYSNEGTATPLREEITESSLSGLLYTPLLKSVGLVRPR